MIRTIVATLGKFMLPIHSGRRTQVVKGGVCKTSMQRFESARRLQIIIDFAKNSQPATSSHQKNVPVLCQLRSQNRADCFLREKKEDWKITEAYMIVDFYAKVVLR